MNELPTIVVGDSDEVPAQPNTMPPLALLGLVALVFALLWAFGGVAPPAADRIPVPVRLVGSSAADVESRLYEVSANGSREAPLPDLREAQFDRSGNLLAGIAPSDAPRGGVLTVGPPEGPFQQLSDDVRSFAWHDRRPGSLAYVSPWGPVAAINTWEQGATNREVIRDRGLMHRFGDWGYAVTRPGSIQRADLYDASGDFEQQVPGYPAGTGPGAYLVFSPQVPVRSLPREGTEAVAYTEAGEPFDVPWLNEGELPYVIEAAPDGRRFAVHLGGAYETGLGEVLIARFDGAIETRISRAATPAALAWSGDGRYLVVARRGPADELEIGFYDLDAQTLDVAPLPEIPSSVVIWDIAVPDAG